MWRPGTALWSSSPRRTLGCSSCASCAPCPTVGVPRPRLCVWLCVCVWGRKLSGASFWGVGKGGFWCGRPDACCCGVHAFGRHARLVAVCIRRRLHPARVAHCSRPLGAFRHTPQAEPAPWPILRLLPDAGPGSWWRWCRCVYIVCLCACLYAPVGCTTDGRRTVLPLHTQVCARSRLGCCVSPLLAHGEVRGCQYDSNPMCQASMAAGAAAP